MSNLSVALLGSFEATMAERPLPSFRTKSVQALLIYLLCEANQPHQREALMTLLWPDLPLLSAQASMRQTLYRLRKLIPEVKGQDGEVVPFLLSNRQTIQINPDADYFLDVAAFDKGDPAQAIALYRGDFLADFYLPDSETFEEWVAGRRAVYRQRVLAMMEALTAVHLQRANFEEAAQLAQQQLEIDNLRESSHRQLMEAWARNGRRQEAISHYNHLRQLLQEELAIEPSQETVALLEKIRADNFIRQPIHFYSEPERPKHNLPRRLTSFVGREKEMAAITKLISHNRLVMLTGVGGIGKTNLCLEVGQALFDMFPDGIWLVELAPIANPALVPQTAAHALGLRATSDRPILDVLLDFLLEKACLLILDNCEHVINAAAQIAETVLQTCPDVKILASSREALAIPGEVSFQVSPLSIPDMGQLPSLAEWEQYDALRLFVERATPVLPYFQVTQDNITPLVQICQRLDGIPLALELAAARIKMLTAAQISARLDDRFRLLTGGSRTALPRQQTLRASIDWSWDLLSDAEQLLLQRLSVFSGGMSLEAVESVCAGNGLEAYELLDGLSELVNKSLVTARREQGQPPRYNLLETIRQYGQERLCRAGEEVTFRQRHLDYFVHLAEQAETGLKRAEQRLWLKWVEKERDNIRVTIGWAQERDVAAGLRLATALAEFHRMVNDSRECEMWLAQLLSQAEKVATTIRAKAMLMQAYLAIAQPQHKQAQTLVEEGLALFREVGDQHGMAYALFLRAWLTLLIGGNIISKAWASLEESLTLYRALGDKLGIARVLSFMGYTAGRINYNYEKAMAYFEESESLFQEGGHLFGTAELLELLGYAAVEWGHYALARLKLEESLALQESLGLIGKAFTWQLLGRVYVRQCEYVQAHYAYEKAMSISQQAGDRVFEIWNLVYQGYLCLQEGKLAEARERFVYTLRQFNEAEYIGGVAYVIEGFAGLAVRQAEAKRAVRLIAGADALRELYNILRTPVYQTDVDHNIDSILEMMDEEAYASAYAEGKAMTKEQVIALALANNNVVGSLNSANHE